MKYAVFWLMMYLMNSRGCIYDDLNRLQLCHFRRLKLSVFDELLR